MKGKKVVKRRAKWGTLDQLLLNEVQALRKAGVKKAIRIDPKDASARSVAGKVSALRKENHPEFLDVRVTVVDKAAFLYLGAGSHVEERESLLV